MQISVELEGGREAFLPGEEVAGVVRLVALDGAVKCRKVTAQLRWHTEGKGDKDKGGPAEVEIHPGPMIEGTLEVPFRQRLPLAPSSYNGVLVKVIWTLCVRVDQPWAKDSVLEQPISVA